jgi:hypothetical protein
VRTRKLSGNTVSKNLTPEQAAVYRPWLERARRLHELVALPTGSPTSGSFGPRLSGRSRGLRRETLATGALSRLFSGLLSMTLNPSHVWSLADRGRWAFPGP